MSKFLPCLAACIVLAAAPMSLRAEKATFPADPTSSRVGIGSYVVERSGKVVDVEIKDPIGATMGTLAIEFDTPEGILLTLSKGKANLRLTWKSSSPTFTLTDLKNGAAVKRTMELAAPHSSTTTGSNELLKKYEKEVSFAFTALDETMTNLGLYEYFFGQRPAAPIRPRVGNNCPPSCNGAYISSTTAAGSRSRCCEIATQGTNGACSNFLCIGCCRIIGCDAACLAGTDFACVCQVTGQACGESPLPCDSTWPPECI